MLPRAKRLNLKKSFRWVASGTKTENNLVKIFYRSGENNIPKVGVATSKSVFSQAVDRNRAKRKIFTSFQGLYNNLPANINIVVMPKNEILKKEQTEIDIEIKELLAKIIK